MGIDEDVGKRIMLATQAFKSLHTLWKNRNLVNERVRIMSYRAIVESVLLYNCATWALNTTQAQRLDIVQRRMLRQIIGLKMSDRTSNDALYVRCNVQRASAQVIDARWRMFGHTLRMDEDTPARKAMTYYFSSDQPGRQGNFLTIASVLSKEFEGVTGRKIKTLAEYKYVIQHAQDRKAWQQLVSNVVCIYMDKSLKKAEKNHEKRRESKAKAEKKPM